MQRFAELVESYQSGAIETTQVRRWGVEIESPNVGRFGDELAGLGWDMTTDTSVEEPDCECECSDCLHDCDCDRCDIQRGYDSPDHCGTCTSNEASSPVLLENRFNARTRGLLAEVAEMVTEDPDSNEGGHIHIEARDLTLAQVALIQKGYLKIERLLGREFTGRGFCHYAQNYQDHGEHDRLGERYCAVNVTNLVRYDGFGYGVWRDNPDRPEIDLSVKGQRTDTYKTTIEFRQFMTTGQPAIIEARASVCRALVDYFANGGAWYWFNKADTAEAMLELLRPQFH